MHGVGLMVRVVGLESLGPEFKSCSGVELTLGGVNSACHPSDVGKMSASMLVYCRSGDPSRIVPNRQGDCLSSTNALHRVWSQSPPPYLPFCVHQSYEIFILYHLLVSRHLCSLFSPCDFTVIAAPLY